MLGPGILATQPLDLSSLELRNEAKDKGAIKPPISTTKQQHHLGFVHSRQPVILDFHDSQSCKHCCGHKSSAKSALIVSKEKKDIKKKNGNKKRREREKSTVRRENESQNCMPRTKEGELVRRMIYGRSRSMARQI